MTTLREGVSRLWGTLRPHSNHEWQDELRLHLELAAEDAQRRGDSPDHAARAARLRAGSIPQAIEALHDQHGFPWVEDLARDLRHGLLALKRNPAFTTIAVLTLALGVGVNSAIFSVVYAVLLRPLPYHEPDRLVSAGSMLAGEYLFLRDHTETLRGIALTEQPLASISRTSAKPSGAQARTYRPISSPRSASLRSSVVHFAQPRSSPARAQWSCSATPCGVSASGRMRASSGATS
jgi:hypothetical protein